MLILIVEDNAFNAFCLSRILTATLKGCQVKIASDSSEALSMIDADQYDAVIVDGDLGASDGMNCNGPALTDAIWSEYPWITVIAWSDSSSMRQAFSEVFKRHNKLFNEYFCWPKIIQEQSILAFWSYCYPYQRSKFNHASVYET